MATEMSPPKDWLTTLPTRHHRMAAMEVWEMEYQHTDYRHDQAVCVELQQAVRNRHWSPERLAQATALPAHTVLKHLGGELEPSADELLRYCAALGLSRERLLAKAALGGVQRVRTDRRASLLAVQELLSEIWGEATGEEREQMLGYVQQLGEHIQQRRQGSRLGDAKVPQESTECERCVEYRAQLERLELESVAQRRAVLSSDTRNQIRQHTATARVQAGLPAIPKGSSDGPEDYEQVQ